MSLKLILHWLGIGCYNTSSLNVSKKCLSNYMQINVTSYIMTIFAINIYFYLPITYSELAKTSYSKFSSCSINFSKADECDAISPRLVKPVNGTYMHTQTIIIRKFISRHKITYLYVLSYTTSSLLWSTWLHICSFWISAKPISCFSSVVRLN